MLEVGIWLHLFLIVGREHSSLSLKSLQIERDVDWYSNAAANSLRPTSQPTDDEANEDEAERNDGHRSCSFIGSFCCFSHALVFFLCCRLCYLYLELDLVVVMIMTLTYRFIGMPIPYHNYNYIPGGGQDSDSRVQTQELLVHDPYHDPVCTVMNDQNENGKS